MTCFTAMRVFVDTSYFIARLVERDQWHKKARKAAAARVEPVTSSLVINETVSLLQARGQLSAALTFLRVIRDSAGIQVVYVDPAIQNDGWDLFGKWGGLGANAIDCTSFAIMRKMAIHTAFTFDEHFRAAGFEALT